VSRSESTPRDGPCISSRKASNNSICLAASREFFFGGELLDIYLLFLREAEIDGREGRNKCWTIRAIKAEQTT
jgi:hypothetical protein